MGRKTHFNSRPPGRDLCPSRKLQNHPRTMCLITFKKLEQNESPTAHECGVPRDDGNGHVEAAILKSVLDTRANGAARTRLIFTKLRSLTLLYTFVTYLWITWLRWRFFFCIF